MGTKHDGTEQAQNGGRKTGSVAKTKLADLADPEVVFSKAGIAQLIPKKDATPEVKAAFKEATSVAFDRFLDAFQPRVLGVIDKLLGRLEAEGDAIPVNFVALNIKQLAEVADKLQGMRESVGSGQGSTTTHNHLHVEVTEARTADDIFATLLGKPKTATPLAQAPSALGDEEVRP
jgi:hypothetical protein